VWIGDAPLGGARFVLRWEPSPASGRPPMCTDP